MYVVVLDCVISVLAAARLQVATGIRSRNLRLSFLTINVVRLTTAFQRWRRWKSSAVLTHDATHAQLVRDARICLREQGATKKQFIVENGGISCIRTIHYIFSLSNFYLVQAGIVSTRG